LPASGICPVLPPPGKPEHNHACQESQYQFSHNGDHKIANAITSFGFENHPVDGVADNSGEEHDEGIDHSLNQGEGYHIAIGDVAYFVCHNRPGFFGAESLQQSRTLRYQSVIAVLSSGKSVGRL